MLYLLEILVLIIFALRLVLGFCLGIGEWRYKYSTKDTLVIETTSKISKAAVIYA